MPLYEHVLLARQDITQQQVETLVQDVDKIVKDKGGKVCKTEFWGLRNLAYKIKKYRKAHYAMLDIDAPADAIFEVERQLRLNENVIRYLTVRVDKHEEGSSVIMQKRERDEQRKKERELRAIEGQENDLVFPDATEEEKEAIEDLMSGNIEKLKIIDDAQFDDNASRANAESDQPDAQTSSLDSSTDASGLSKANKEPGSEASASAQTDDSSAKTANESESVDSETKSEKPETSATETESTSAGTESVQTESAVEQSTAENTESSGEANTEKPEASATETESTGTESVHPESAVEQSGAENTESSGEAKTEKPEASASETESTGTDTESVQTESAVEQSATENMESSGEGNTESPETSMVADDSGKVEDAAEKLTDTNEQGEKNV